MVRLFRGGVRGRGRGMPRPPLMMPRPMRPLEYKPDFVPPYSVGPLRGRLMRGLPVRHGPPHPHHHLPPPPNPPPPPRMGLLRPLAPPLPPPLPPRRLPLPPLQPLHPMEMSRRPHPLDVPVRPLRMPPPPMGPPLRRPLIPGPPIVRGRGVLRRGLPVGRGVSVKRLGVTANGRAKKPQKRKEKTEDMELNKPWVTEALKTEIHKKYQLYETAKEKKTDGDWQAYKDQRILVGKMTNTAKLEYIGTHPDADVEQIMFGGTPKQ